jgi:hypothetical protein
MWPLRALYKIFHTYYVINFKHSAHFRGHRLRPNSPPFFAATTSIIVLKSGTHSVPSHHREIAIQILTWNFKPTSHPHLTEYKIRIASIHSSTTSQSVLKIQKKLSFAFHPHPTQHDNILQCCSNLPSSLTPHQWAHCPWTISLRSNFTKIAVIKGVKPESFS